MANNFICDKRTRDIRGRFVKEVWSKEKIIRFPKSVGNKNALGSIRSDEFKENIKKKNTGRKHNQEWINKMIKSKKEYFNNNPEAIIKMREFRRTQIFPIKDTTIEVKIQNFLKQLNIEFFTHQYMHIEHGYQCDIMIPNQDKINQKTIIECFGTYWHKYPLGREIDIQRCMELRKSGWRVLVFWENEIRKMEVINLKNKLYNETN